MDKLKIFYAKCKFINFLVDGGNNGIEWSVVMLGRVGAKHLMMDCFPI
jgi:hypothetical protein